MTTATTSQASNVVEFVHRGRKRRIFRRGPQGIFYSRRQVGGRDHWKSLDTPLKTTAIANAKAWLDAIQTASVDAKWSALDPVRSRSPFATVQQIIDRFEERAAGALRIDAHTVATYCNCLANVVRLATGSEPDAVKADALTEATVRTFVEQARAAGRSESGIRSTLVQARSVLAPAALYIYAPDLRIPADLSGFRTKIRFETAEDIGFEPIPNEAIAEMETAAAALRSADPATWLVYMLMSRLGLRNVECERATLDWLDADGLHLNVPETKGGRSRHLSLPDDLTADQIREIAGSGPNIIPAPNSTDRKIICQRSINRFVERFIPDREKVSYELRKWAGSLVWSSQGAEAAMHFLGHRLMTTTSRYYAKFLRPVRAVSAADRAAVLKADVA